MDRGRNEIIAKLQGPSISASPSVRGPGLQRAAGPTPQRHPVSSLRGPELRTDLEKIADRTAHEAASRRRPGVVDIDTSLITGKPEFEASTSTAIARPTSGCHDVDDVATTLRLLVAGLQGLRLRRSTARNTTSASAPSGSTAQRHGNALKLHERAFVAPSGSVAAVGRS